MKKLMITTLVLSSLNLFAQTPQVVEAPVDHIFVPNGFDNNDNIELVVTGKFPNPCYTKNKVDVKVRGDIITLKVTSLRQSEERLARCEPMKVPFSEVVTVGNLQGGSYRVIVNQGGRFELRDELDVEMSTSTSVDENLYALVDHVELGFTGGLSGDAVLVARTVSTCLKLDRVEYLSNSKDTLSVLPIMKKISQDCPERKSRLQIPIKFNLKKFAHDKVLLFVRSIEGKSVHKLIEK